MIEIIKLLEYADIAGHSISANGDKVRVQNGKTIPYHLKHQIVIHKDDILEYLSN